MTMTETEFPKAVADLKRNPSDLKTRSHPAYAEGFYDAADLAPLFDDAHAAYRAGWLAYWVAREIMARP